MDKVNGVSGESLPTKVSPWTKIKNFLFQDITVTMTPKQAKVIGEVKDFWCQEITGKDVKEFFCQEITGADVKEFLCQEITLQQMKDFWFQKIEF